jgi:hypothetical protein
MMAIANFAAQAAAKAAKRATGSEQHGLTNTTNLLAWMETRSKEEREAYLKTDKGKSDCVQIRNFFTANNMEMYDKQPGLYSKFITLCGPTLEAMNVKAGKRRNKRKHTRRRR